MAWFSITKLVFKEIYRKKDFYVAFILILVILFYVSQIRFYNIENISRYIREIGLTLIYLFTVFLAVPLAARQLPSEQTQRTLAVLLAKPVSRFQFILGKFIGSYLAALSCFLIFYVLFVALAFPQVQSTDWIAVGQTAYLFGLGLLLIVAISHTLSHFMTFGANITITLITYFMMSIYGDRLDAYFSKAPSFINEAGMTLCHLLPHIEFFDMRQRLVHDWGSLPAVVVGLLTIYALLYSSALLLVSWAKFRKAFL